MGIITKIESQKKRDDRVNIYVDEKFFMAIYKELVFTFNLKKGQEIDPNNLKSILDNEMYMKAKNKALKICTENKWFPNIFINKATTNEYNGVIIILKSLYGTRPLEILYAKP